MTGISRFTGTEIADTQELSEAITTILTTPKGSRVMRRDFGSDLPRLIDAPVNGETVVDLYAAVAEALARWEPRIVLRRVQLVDATAGQMRFAIEADTIDGLLSLDVGTRAPAGTAPAAPDPTPETPVDPGLPFAIENDVAFHFTASSGVFGADGVTPAADGEPVARWLNWGTGADAIQGDAARRPVFRTGGIAGRGYIQCDPEIVQHFEDLDFEQPGGNTNVNPYTVFAVTDGVDNSDFTALLGSTDALGGKMGLYFRPQAEMQIHFAKALTRAGNVTNPQMIMAALGRSASGVLTQPYARIWTRQNGQNVFTDQNVAGENFSSLDITSTQFLRNTGLINGGYFSGHLYELLIIKQVLDDATTFEIEAWLAARYGITIPGVVA